MKKMKPMPRALSFCLFTVSLRPIFMIGHLLTLSTHSAILYNYPCHILMKVKIEISKRKSGTQQKIAKFNLC